MKRIGKILSLVLAVVLIFSLVAGYAQADDEIDESELTTEEIVEGADSEELIDEAADSQESIDEEESEEESADVEENLEEEESTEGETVTEEESDDSIIEEDLVTSSIDEELVKETTTVNFTITIEWNDNNDQYKERPDSLYVIVSDSSTSTSTKQLDFSSSYTGNTWTETFSVNSGYTTISDVDTTASTSSSSNSTGISYSFDNYYKYSVGTVSTDSEGNYSVTITLTGYDKDTYSGSLYHVDIRIDSSYTFPNASTSSQATYLTIKKVWKDGLDHSDETTTVYLLDSSGNKLKDSSGNIRTVTLYGDGSNSTRVSKDGSTWTKTISGSYISDVEEVEEKSISGYSASYSDISVSSTGSSGETTSTSYTGTINVTDINSVSYTNTSGSSVTMFNTTYANGATITVAGTYYTKTTAQDSTSGYEQEFMLDYGGTNGLRNPGLQGLTTNSTITIVIDYTYTYLDENGNEKTSAETQGTFTYNAGDNNTCGEVNYNTKTGNTSTNSTYQGYDAVISGEAIANSIYGSTITKSVTITNTLDDLDINVYKKWNDNNNTYRPTSVVVFLYANGENTNNYVLLNEENNWTDSFDDLSIYDDNGNQIVYTVVEEVPDGYSSSITGNIRDGFTVTNTLKTIVTTKNSNNDDSSGILTKLSNLSTSDNINIGIYIGIGLIALIGIIVIRRKKNQGI